MKTKLSHLEKNGFNPAAQPNTKLLTHSDVVKLLVPTGLLKREDLDPGIMVCVEARDACHGMESPVQKFHASAQGTSSLISPISSVKRR
jgi:hypothetical protein